MLLDQTFSSPWQLIGARLILASLMASLGALVAVSFKDIKHNVLCALISFAAGALLSVVLFDIVPETMEMLGLARTLAGFGAGYVFFYLITKLVFHLCPACAATHTEVKFKAISTAMVVALSIHSIMDGLAIYSGYASGSRVGLSILIAVVFHKFPEGLALTLVALASGMKRSRAFLLTVLLESLTTLAGGAVGFLFLLPESSSWIGWVLGFVGGGFVFLVCHALLSEMIRHNPRNTLLAALAGALSVTLTGLALGAL